jgi:hypothetical protein
MDIKTEGTSLIKTLGAIAASFGVVWTFVEPIVEDYIHEQIQIVQEEDKKMIEELRIIVDEDHDKALKGRNTIINEIQFFYPNTRLRKEE